MKLGIMQPYFLPYIGYWQLMNLVDKYVIYDDVNFIKGGWINRNRILCNGKVNYINIQLSGMSPFKKINEIENKNDEIFIKKNLKMLESSYKKAPYFSDIMPKVEKILCSNHKYLIETILESFDIVTEYLDIKTEMLLSSKVPSDNNLKGQERVINICELMKATEYYNAIGGMELYSAEEFEKHKIALKFLKTKEVKYTQFSNEFYPNLSILDVMMFNSRKELIDMLKAYEIVEVDK